MTSYKLEIKEEASLEALEAYLYYEEQQKGLGERFLKQLDASINYLRENPLHCQIKHSVYREALVKVFPYIIIYELAKDTVVVFSIFNTYRNPKSKP